MCVYLLRKSACWSWVFCFFIALDWQVWLCWWLAQGAHDLRVTVSTVFFDQRGGSCGAVVPAHAHRHIDLCPWRWSWLIVWDSIEEEAWLFIRALLDLLLFIKVSDSVAWMCPKDFFGRAFVVLTQQNCHAAVVSDQASERETILHMFQGLHIFFMIWNLCSLNDKQGNHGCVEAKLANCEEYDRELAAKLWL